MASQSNKAQNLIHDLVDEIHYEFRGKVVIEAKNGTKYWKLINKLVSVVSFGSVDFSRSSITALGPRIGIPIRFVHTPERTYRELMKTRKYLRHYARLGNGNLWLGFVVFLCLYVLPVSFGYCRALFSKEAYKEVIRAHVTLYGKLYTEGQVQYLKNHCMAPFSGWFYYYTWPFTTYFDKWFYKAYNEVLIEEGINNG